MNAFQTRLFQRVRRSPTAIALIVLAALWLLFFWRLLTPVVEDRVIFAPGDFPLHYFSYSDYQVQRLWDGAIPLWNPYNYGGDPFAANVQWAVWYPPRWIAALLAGPHGWRIEVYQMEGALHYAAISLMMYAFLRALLRRRPAPLADPALIGSLLWTYGGYLTGYPMLQPSILYAIAWLPLLLLSLHLSLTRPAWRLRGMLFAAMCFALSFFGGHTQTTVQITYLAAAYIAFMAWRARLPLRETIWRIGLLGIGGAALAAVQLLPAVELMQRSFRTEDYHFLDKSVGFTFTELVQMLWPRLFEAQWWPLYPGVLALLLLGAALWRLRAEYTFWFGVIVVGLWLSLGGNSVAYDLFYTVVPGWSIFRQQERAASLVIFAVIVLATYGLEALLHDDPAEPDRRPDLLRRLTWLARGHLALALIAYLVWVFVLLVRGDDPKDVTANAFGLVALVSLLLNGWLVWARRGTSALTAAALIALIVAELFTLGMKSPNFVPDTPYNRVKQPDVLDYVQRDWQDIDFLVDGAAGIQTYGTYWRIPDIFGTGPFRLATLEKLRRLRVDRRWEVFAIRYATMSGEVPDNVPLQAIAEGTGPDGTPYTLYELTDPRPFAHLVYDARTSEHGEEGAREIMREPWINLREIAVVQEPLPVTLPGTRPADAQVRAFKMLEPEYMEMEVSTSAPALLTLPVANYPGWRATVNGQRVEIVDTYAGLIGIPITPGQGQKVTLQFLPTSVIVGGAVSALAWIAVLGALLLTLRRRVVTAPSLHT